MFPSNFTIEQSKFDSKNTHKVQLTMGLRTNVLHSIVWVFILKWRDLSPLTSPFISTVLAQPSQKNRAHSTNSVLQFSTKLFIQLHTLLFFLEKKSLVQSIAERLLCCHHHKLVELLILTVCPSSILNQQQ